MFTLEDIKAALERIWKIYQDLNRCSCREQDDIDMTYELMEYPKYMYIQYIPDYDGNDEPMLRSSELQRQRWSLAGEYPRYALLSKRLDPINENYAGESNRLIETLDKFLKMPDIERLDHNTLYGAITVIQGISVDDEDVMSVELECWDTEDIPDIGTPIFLLSIWNDPTKFDS